MLSGLQSAHRVFGVHAVGQNDIDNVDFRVVLERVVVVVVVDVFGTDPIALRQFVGFVGVAAYEGNDLRFFAFGKRWQNLINGETAQADDGPT
jgi:hypothetical protein